MSAEPQPVTTEDLQRIWGEVQNERDGTVVLNPEELPPEEEETPEVELEAEPPEEVLEENEPLSELDEIKQRLDQLQGLDRRVRNTEGHLGGMNSKLDQLQTQLQEGFAARNVVADAPTQDQILAATESDDYWTELERDYPEWAKAFEQRLTKVPSGPSMDRIQEEIQKGVTQATEDFEMRLLNTVHRGWKTTVNTPAFSDWFRQADPDLQALANSTKAEDAIEMLDAFKESQRSSTQNDADRIKADREKRLKEAQSLPKGGTPAPQQKSVEEMSRAELWEHEKRLRQKR